MGILEPVTVTVALGLLFNFSNGFHDASNIVSTIVSTRSMGLSAALAMTAVLVLAGSALLGTSVARTIGEGIVDIDVITQAGVASAVAAAVSWNILTWALGLPSASSHALIGGLVGAALAEGGPAAIHLWSLAMIFAVILAAPPLGFACAFFMTRAVMHLFKDMSPNTAGPLLRRLQVASGALLALTHGANDGQKAMGLITMAIVVSGRAGPVRAWALNLGDPGFMVPAWVVWSCSLFLALGMFTGGGRIIRTMGTRFYRIRPHHGLGTMLSSSLVVYACTLAGFPVSTTHIASSGVLGSGAAERLGIVRWGLAGDILITWVLTLPTSAALAFLLTAVLT